MRIYTSLAYILSGVLITPASFSAVIYRTVAISGQQAPGTSNGEVFGSAGFVFDRAVLNNSDQVAFAGLLEDDTAGVTPWNRLGIWAGDIGNLRLASRTGMSAPGIPEAAGFGSFGALRLNEAGQVAFTGGLDNRVSGIDSDNDEGLWSEGSGVLSLVARTGQHAPGTASGVVFENFSSSTSFAFNNSGSVAFQTILRPFQEGEVTFDNWQGIWLEGVGTLELIARQGSQAPGLPPGYTFDEIDGFGMNDAGQIVLSNKIINTNTQASNRGLWHLGPAAPGLIGLLSDPVPGEPDTTTYFTRSGLYDDSGQLLQVARVRRETEDTRQLDGGFWLVKPSGLEALIETGVQAPGLPPGTVFQEESFVISQLNIINEDVIAAEVRYFPSAIGSNKGIWAGAPDNLSLIALGGSHAPGTPTNAIFLAFYDLVLNGLGQVAFEGQLALSLGNVNSDNNRGVWATDLLGELHLIAREGDEFEVAPGDVRTIFAAGINPTQSFNDLGTLLLQLSFTDGSSGLFAVTVPEPCATIVITLGISAFCIRR